MNMHQKIFCTKMICSFPSTSLTTLSMSVFILQFLWQKPHYDVLHFHVSCSCSPAAEGLQTEDEYHGTTPFSELCSGWVHRVFFATGFWHVGPDNQCENGLNLAASLQEWLLMLVYPKQSLCMYMTPSHKPFTKGEHFTSICWKHSSKGWFAFIFILVYQLESLGRPWEI